MRLLFVFVLTFVFVAAGCIGIPEGYEPLGPSVVSGPLRILPPYARIIVGQRQDFEASGGDGKYEWSLIRDLGTLRIQGVSGRWYSYQSSVPEEEFRIIVKSGDGQAVETFGIVVFR